MTSASKPPASMGADVGRPRARLRDGAVAAAAIVRAARFGAFTRLPLAALLVHLPVASLVDMMHREVVVQALRLSFETTVAAAALTVIGGTPLAALLAREFRGRDALASFVTLPLVLPPVVAGLGLLLAFGRAGLLGRPLDGFGMPLPFSTFRCRVG